jgi:hypothetical protein
MQPGRPQEHRRCRPDLLLRRQLNTTTDIESIARCGGGFAEATLLPHRYAAHVQGSKQMLRIAILCCGIFCFDLAQAQDIAGIEDCTKTSGLDKRTGCLQSNINLLQQLLTRNSRDYQQRLSAALNEIVALKSTVASLQARVEQLQAERKPAPDKKPDAK